MSWMWQEWHWWGSFLQKERWTCDPGRLAWWPRWKRLTQGVHYCPWRKLRIRKPKNFNKRSVCLGVGEGQKDGGGGGVQGSPHCPNSDWEQEEGSGTALCLQLLWRRWLLGGMAEEGWEMGRLLTLHLVWTKSLAHSPLLSLCPGLPCLRVPWILSLSVGTPTNSNLHRSTLWGLSAL